MAKLSRKRKERGHPCCMEGTASFHGASPVLDVDVCLRRAAWE